MKSAKDKLKKNDDLKHQEKLVDVAEKSKTIKKASKLMKPKAAKLAKNEATVKEAKETQKKLSVADLAKIEKKKAKKQAQKLKRQQKKSTVDAVEMKSNLKVRDMPKTEITPDKKKSIPEAKSATKLAKKTKGKINKKKDVENGGKRLSLNLLNSHNF